MKQILIIIFLGLFSLSYAQKFPELEKILIKEFPANSTKDGRWVFHADKAEIEELNDFNFSSELKKFNIYRLELTNHLGYHVNSGTCIVLTNKSMSKFIFVEPMWYSGVSESLIKPFLGKAFSDRTELLNFISELHTILEYDSGNKLILTEETEDKLYFDLVQLEGNSTTIKSEFSTSTVNHKKNKVYRKIEIGLKNLKIKDYIIINPRLEQNKEISDTLYFFDETITIFPNPNDGSFEISLPFISEEIDRIQVINQTGQIVFEKTSHIGNEINIPNPIPGMYFVSFVSKGKVFTQKIIIK